MRKTVLAGILLSFFCILVSCSNNHHFLDRLLEEGAYQEVIDRTTSQFQRTKDPELLIYRARALDRLGQSSKALDVIKLYAALTPLSKQEHQELSVELALKNQDWAYLVSQAEILKERNRLTIDYAKEYYRALLKTGRTQEAKTLFSEAIRGTLSPSEEAKLLIASEVDPAALETYLGMLSIEEQVNLVLEVVPLGLDPSSAEAWFISRKMQKSDTPSFIAPWLCLPAEPGGDTRKHSTPGFTKKTRKLMNNTFDRLHNDLLMISNPARYRR